jgi:uncharacterized protein YndB with AHSA1/START domain
MIPTHSIYVEREIEAAAEAVFRRISDHAETHTWVKPARVRVLSAGAPAPNGLGAVREVAFPEQRFWSAIKERVTAFEPPRTFSYKITEGMPGLKDHLGTLTVEPLGPGRSRLSWRVDFVFSRWHPIGWIAGRFTRTFRGVLDSALGELARQMRPSHYLTDIKPIAPGEPRLPE